MMGDLQANTWFIPYGQLVSFPNDSPQLAPVMIKVRPCRSHSGKGGRVRIWLAIKRVKNTILARRVKRKLVKLGNDGGMTWACVVSLCI
jgi:hypothetical protein